MRQENTKESNKNQQQQTKKKLTRHRFYNENGRASVCIRKDQQNYVKTTTERQVNRQTNIKTELLTEQKCM